MRTIAVAFLLFALASGLFAQAPDRAVCGIDHIIGSIRQSNPKRYSIYKQLESERFERLHSKKTSDTVTATQTVTIPVVVHVIYANDTQNISDEQILSQIEVLNEDFRRKNADTVLTPDRFRDVAADCNIEFCLARYDPNGFETTGIVRVETHIRNIGSTDHYYKTLEGGSNIWDPSSYLNIWVCEVNDTLLGFAYYPGLSKPEYDGVVMNYLAFGKMGTVVKPFNKGRTTTHEVAHWLGVRHPWGEEESCDDDDGIADTPLQEKPNSKCPSGVKISCDNGPLGDMYMNYMDYTFDACENIFTEGQKAVMWDALHNERKSILSSRGCTGPDSNKLTFPDIRIYPNPSGDWIEIAFRFQSVKDVKITFFSVNGYELKQERLQLQTETRFFDIAGIPQGVYIITIVSDEFRHVTKLIKL